MAIRNRWRFGGGLLASLTLCVAVHSQQDPTAPPLPPSGQSPYPDVGTPDPAPRLGLVPQTPTPPPAAKRQTIEDLIAAIKAIRAKKAELDRQEQALAGELKKRVEEQGKQLAELGIGRSAGQPTGTQPATVPPIYSPVGGTSDGAPKPPPYRSLPESR